MTEIIHAQQADIGALAALIAEAFCDLPPSRWLIGDQASRRKIFPFYFQIAVEHALAHGVVHTTPQRTAAALWLPVPGEPPPQPPGYVPRLTSLTSPWTGRFLSFDRTLDTHHPAGTPHHHLAMLAVHPSAQGGGIGTALLKAHHHELDRTRQAAYLEASGERSRDLYLRHGYVLRPDGPFYLPDCGPPFWPMWREPRHDAGLAGREAGAGPGSRAAGEPG